MGNDVVGAAVTGASDNGAAVTGTSVTGAGVIGAAVTGAGVIGAAVTGLDVTGEGEVVGKLVRPPPPPPALGTPESLPLPDTGTSADGALVGEEETVSVGSPPPLVPSGEGVDSSVGVDGAATDGTTLADGDADESPLSVPPPTGERVGTKGGRVGPLPIGGTGEMTVPLGHRYTGFNPVMSEYGSSGSPPPAKLLLKLSVHGPVTFPRWMDCITASATGFLRNATRVTRRRWVIRAIVEWAVADLLLLSALVSGSVAGLMDRTCRQVDLPLLPFSFYLSSSSSSSS